MKKNTINIFIVLFLISNIFFSAYAVEQNTNVAIKQYIRKENNNKIDIKKIVRQQIETAKIKQRNIKNTYSIKDRTYKTKNSGLSKYFMIALTIIKKIDARILIFTGAVFIIFLFIGIRRAHITETIIHKKSKSLTRNIAMIRNEEPFFSEDKQLTKVRQKLKERGHKKENFIDQKITNTFVNQVYKTSKLATENSLINFNYEISNTAKRLSISKSEILLALKLKAYELGKGDLIRN